MKIFQINGGVFGSTGKIMFGIAGAAQDLGHETLCAAPITTTNRSQQPEESYIKIIGFHRRRLNVLLARLTGYEGCFSVFPTLKLLRKIKEFDPDVLHLHNIHESFLNLPLLFRFIKKSGIRVVWTLHDCWAFTGHCPYFDMANCNKWKTGCFQCPLFREYPKSFTDNSKKMYKLKKSWFTGIEDMTLVTPSKWLAELVKQSFLRGCSVQVIHNGIDRSVFKPSESNFRRKYHLENKTIILGVAFGWEKRKGLDVFIQLANELDERFRIVLVGTDETVDRQLPNNIISVHRTKNQMELAELYSVADIFVNPTREDNYPTVNLEAIACGTPVITFKTGGSPECVEKGNGIVVDKDDFIALKQAIMEMAKKKLCVEGALPWDQTEAALKVLELYNKL